MVASVIFRVYGDFSGRSFAESVSLLSAQVASAVADGSLHIVYRGRPVEVMLPVTEADCGELCIPSEGAVPYFDGVEIWCRFREEGRFRSEMMAVGMCPGGFVPLSIEWNEGYRSI